MAEYKLSLTPSPQFFWNYFRKNDYYQELAPFAALYLSWPWATFGVLQIFSASMRKARVRKMHVLRCIIYSADIAAWAAIAGLSMIFACFALGALFGFDWFATLLAWISIGSMLVVIAVGFCYRLGTAYRMYLKFDHPFLTILSSQIIVFLAFLFLVVSSLGRDF